MHEYEFRLSVGCDRPFDSLLRDVAASRNAVVVQELVRFAKPHFRFRRGVLSYKRMKKAEAVYHDGLWFRWVHSIETPFERWPRSRHNHFVNEVANAQDGIKTQVRKVVQLDASTKVYSFLEAGVYVLVFEWEYGEFPRRIDRHRGPEWLSALSEYRDVYRPFRRYALYPQRYGSDGHVSRKPVVGVAIPPTGCLVAHKWDGVFGTLHSFEDRIDEKWEGYVRRTRPGISLGDGLVFAAEKMKRGSEERIVLLDVYEFRGLSTASWSRRAILCQFLPRLRLPEGFRVQVYRANVGDLKPTRWPTDGYVYHDVENDVVYKHKPIHTIDVLYRNGKFVLPCIGKAFECSERPECMREGAVYEVDVTDGRVVRRRDDRFHGNTERQLQNIFETCGARWRGPKWYDV